MISIKRYLDGTSAETYQRVLGLLAEMASEHPVDVDHKECERLKSEIGRIQARFSAKASSDELLVAAGAISQALASYNQSVTNFIQRQGGELQNMISMLTRTIMSLGSASERSAESLGAIEVQIKRASALEDIRVLRHRLEECLNHVRDEAARQRSDTQTNIDRLKHELASSQHRLEHPSTSTDADPVTGLANRPAAEAAIQEAAEAGDIQYIAIVVLGKMHAINSRFGYAIGDEVLCEFAARIVGRLRNHVTFYRWSGPAIVGVLQRSEPLHVIREEVSRVTDDPISKSLANGTQNAFITTSAALSVFQVTHSATDLIAKIDNFVSEQLPKNCC